MSIVFPMMPGIEINLLLLILLGFAIGMISGFAGVGGGFLMAPALIILGFPAHFAVGTSLIWVMANCIIGALRHRQHGNVDEKLGLIMAAASMGGVEIGIRILSRVTSMGVAEVLVLILSVILLLTIGGYIVWESINSIQRGEKIEGLNKADIAFAKLRQTKLKPMIHFTKSNLTISLWIILGLGLFVGILSGLLGVGGGFIMVPSLIYVVGLPSFLAVGTDLFQIVFSSAFGSVRNTMTGNIIIFASFVMVLSSAIGVQFGVLATRFLREICLESVLSCSILVAVLGSILKLINIFTGNSALWLKPAEVSVTFGGLGLILILIAGLLVVAIRFNISGHTPGILNRFISGNMR